MWFEVSATVQTMDVRIAGFPRGEGVYMVPVFCVRAGDKSQAYAKAADIIDPLHMTGLRTIKVRRVRGRGKWKNRKRRS
jgi:hypothetical protein